MTIPTSVAEAAESDAKAKGEKLAAIEAFSTKIRKPDMHGDEESRWAEVDAALSALDKPA